MIITSNIKKEMPMKSFCIDIHAFIEAEDEQAALDKFAGTYGISRGVLKYDLNAEASEIYSE